MQGRPCRLKFHPSRLFLAYFVIRVNARRGALRCGEAPSAKIQAPEKIQSFNNTLGQQHGDGVAPDRFWIFSLFAASLELGVWSLVLPAPRPGARHHSVFAAPA